MRDILIVDDAPNNLRLLAAILTQFGYEVRSCISGKMALMAAQNSPPELILLDINMPDMDGYEVCQLLRKHPSTATTPIIFLTAYSETKDKIKAFQVGAQDYITKPFQADEVIVRIQNQLALRDSQQAIEAARAEAVAALEREQEANRIKSELMGMVYHDFKAPLATIRAYLGLLQESGEGTSPAAGSPYFQKIEASIEFMIHLIDNLLISSQTQLEGLLPHPSVVDLPLLCQDIISMVQLSYGARHRLELTIEETPLSIETDPNLLRQVLTNLLLNAVKYSPPGSAVKLELWSQENQVYFCVRDRGIGIHAADLEQVFTPFYRSPEAAEIAHGNGLGLAAARQCLKALQGKIEIQSQVNQGTTVTVSLPQGG